MLKKNREFLNLCSKIIIEIFETTGLENQEKIVEISKIMSDYAATSDEYNVEMKDIYKCVKQFLENMWADDFLQIKKIIKES